MEYLQRIAGQPRAVEQLQAAMANPVHAYLFSGPSGSGKRYAARAFAAALLCDDRPLRDLHPDVTRVGRRGAALSMDEAREVLRLAAQVPSEGAKRILILEEFHHAAQVAPVLLKTVEEAPPTTIFLILAESVGPELATIASRCIRVEFQPLANEVVVDLLEDIGIDHDDAQVAATSARGDFRRAKQLARDPHARDRRALWLSIRARLDSTGATRMACVDELLAALDDVVAVVDERAASERKALSVRVDAGELLPSVLTEADAAAKREARRIRTEEIREGLALLASEERRRLDLGGDEETLADVDETLQTLAWAHAALKHNPNEGVLLGGLFAKLERE